jgi:hypothetical protein
MLRSALLFSRQQQMRAGLWLCLVQRVQQQLDVAQQLQALVPLLVLCQVRAWQQGLMMKMTALRWQAAIPPQQRGLLLLLALLLLPLRHPAAVPGLPSTVLQQRLLLLLCTGLLLPLLHAGVWSLTALLAHRMSQCSTIPAAKQSASCAVT